MSEKEKDDIKIEETEVKKDGKAEEKKDVKEVEELKNQLAQLTKKYEETKKKFEQVDKEKDEWKNKYYMAYADMANVRKQVEKEANDFKRYAIQDFVKEIIPTLDSFDQALKNEPNDDAVKKYIEGFNMIHRKLLNSLEGQGIEIISPKVGDDYNPNVMQAFSTVDGDSDEKIADVFVKGYKLHEHLLRPAGVIITKKVDKIDDAKKDVNTEDKKEEK